MPNDVSDIDINRQIRQVFVRYWVDLGRLSIRTAGGVVNLRGLLQKIPGATGDINSQSVANIHSDIRRINGVKRIHSDFNNWVFAGDLWQPRDAAVLDQASKGQALDGGTWRLPGEKPA